jgi:hypothetical protein
MKGRYGLGNLSVDGSMILKCILNEQGMKNVTRFI